MKKQMSLFIWAVAVFGMTPVLAATNSGTRAASSADLTSMPATRERANINYQKYETRTTTSTYDVKDGKNLYYTSPSNRSELYKQYDASTQSGATQTVRTTRAETIRSELKRKYYLAHPFFQPLKGKFGSVTDLSYTMNSYDFDIAQTVPVPGTDLIPLNGLGGKWDMKQFAVKEDFSYGITDRIGIMGMLQYNKSDYKFEWNSDIAEDDKMDDSGLNLYGLGAQWRFLDTDEWIATVSAYFQHQKDIANSYILDLKGGYKISRSTIYGLLRGWYVDIDGDSYGNGISGHDANGNYALMYIPYKVDDKAFYIEGGVGVFSVLDEDWTLNVEGVFGDYDWHNQFSIKAAIGWQPNDWFALNLYAKTALYDSADDKKLDMYWLEPAVGYDSLTKIGTAKLDSYSETVIGLQAIFQF